MIVDCSLVFTELDLLRLRLEELWNVVDRFIVVEGTHTFSGKPKPLYFLQDIDCFADYTEKIFHVTVDLSGSGFTDAWQREFAQRNAVLRGMDGVPEDAWVILADVDELPSADALKEAIQIASIPSWEAVRDHVLLQLRNFYYYVNCRGVDDAAWWTGLKMCRLGSLRPDPQKKLRDILPTDPRFLTIHDAGWHFSFCGGADQVRRKIQAFSHTELDRPEFTDPAKIAERIRTLRDPFDRELRWEKVRFDESYPKYLRENRERFKEWILP